MLRGFTLIELLVTIAILAMLAGLLLFNTQSSQNFKLQGEVQKLVANIRLVQEKALSSEQFQGQAPAGWGLYFNSSSNDQYIIFADLNDNGQYNSGNETFKTVKLDPAVQIQSVSNNQATVVYKPPRPAVGFNPSSLTELSVLLALKSVPGKTVVVTINQSGSVDKQ